MILEEPLRALAHALTLTFHVHVGFNIDDLFPEPELPEAEDFCPEDFMDDPTICDGCGMTVDPSMGCVEGADEDGEVYRFHLDCAPVVDE